jgi:hypothetical protein
MATKNDMKTLEEIFRQYVSLRAQGADLQEVKRNLSSDIGTLDEYDKHQLARRIQNWEDERTLHSISYEEREDLRRATSEVHVAVTTIECPTCRTPNIASRTRCQVCGNMLVLEFDGEVYQENTSTAELDDETYFGSASRLVLVLPDGSKRFVVRPQVSVRGMTIGRQSGDNLVKPDVDLTELNAIEYGISRIHATFLYDGRTHTLYVADLDSTNGTTLNGMRLPPKMRTVLRHGDELQLGQMLFLVRFHQVDHN